MAICKGCNKNKELVQQFLAGKYCDECCETHMAQVIKDFKGDTSNTTEMICPFCGQENRNIEDYEENFDDADCDECGNTYAYSRYVEVAYTTQKP